MKFSFKAKIYKIGINPYVSVPLKFTRSMTPVKGYIAIKGKINQHAFIQTLVPVKDSRYRLYVNGPMLKSTKLTVGDSAIFMIEEDTLPRTAEQIPMPEGLKKELEKNKLMPVFKALTNYRQKEILKYLNNLKTTEAVQRNIEKVIGSLKK